MRSRRAGERVLARLRRCYTRLKLTINEAKSAVAAVRGRAFLGYTFWFAQRRTQVRRAVAAKAMERFKGRIRRLTRRNAGRSLEQVVEGLRAYVPGWKAYFQWAQTPGVFRTLDQWLRHRLRALHLKQWKRGSRMYAALVSLGASRSDARMVANNSRCWLANSRYRLNRALPIHYFDRLGVPRLS